MTERIGFIGCGNMAGAIIGGIISGKIKNPSDISIYDIDLTKCDVYKQQGVTLADNEADLASTCKYIFLCVKPQIIEASLKELQGNITEDHVIISIAAGISSSYIKNMLGFDAKVILVMPNTPLLLGCGSTALCQVSPCNNDEYQFIRNIFNAQGHTEDITEDKLREVIPINGSSPAFIYLFTKAITEYAEQKGIDQQKAIHLFSHALIGSAKMMLESGYDLDSLIKMVSSPGGTTLKALESFYDDNFVEIIIKAMNECTNRAYELSK